MKKYILTGFLLLFVWLNHSFASPLWTIPSFSNNKSFYNVKSYYIKVNTNTPSNWRYPDISKSTSSSNGFYGPYYIGCADSNCSSQLKNPIAQVDVSYNSNMGLTTFKLINGFADSADSAVKEFNISASWIEFDWITFDWRFATTSQVCLYSTDWEFHTICANPNKSWTWGVKDMVFYFSKDSTNNFTVVNYSAKKAWSTTISQETLLEYMFWKYTYEQIYNQIESWNYSYTLIPSNEASYIDPYTFLSVSKWGFDNWFSFSADASVINPDDIFNPSNWNENNSWLVLNTNNYRQCSSRIDAIIKYANYYGRCYTMDIQQANWVASALYDYADTIINSHSQILPADIADMRTNIPFCATFAEYNNQLISPASVLNNNLLFDWEWAENVWFVDYYNYKNPFKSIAYSLFRRVRTLSYDDSNIIEFKYDFSSDSVCWGLPSSASDANSEVSSRYNWVKNMFEDDWTGSWTVGDSLFDSTIPVFWIVADKLKSPVVDSYNSGFSQIVPPSCAVSVSIPAMDYLVYGLAIIIILSLFLFL